MPSLSLDFETFSDVDLPARGVYNYVASPRFDILCASYRLDDGPVRTWWPGEPLPECFFRAERITAWNAAFERLCWHSPAARRYGFPPRPADWFHCTAARSRAVGAPGRLERAARFFGLPLNKDLAGLSVLKRYWAPAPGGERLMPDRDARAAIQHYCETDVQLETTLAKLLPDLSPEERNIFLANEALNDRGIGVDVPFVEVARRLKDEAETGFGRELASLTLGDVTSPKQTARILEWLERLGCKLPDLTDDSVSAALEAEDLHPLAARLLGLRQDGAFAAISKYDAVANRVSADARLRGAFVYCGAVQSRRFASFGAQLHNMRRDVPGNWPAILERAMQGKATYAELAACVRLMFTGDLVIGDWSQVEARVLPWLSGELEARKRLMLFELGADLYSATAASMYRVAPDAVTPEQRQGGKVAELSFGYGGGSRANLTMARAFNIALTPEQGEENKRRWRLANPWAPKFWRKLEDAALTAMVEGKASAGRIGFEAQGNTLTMILPSGDRLWYHDATIVEGRYGPQIRCKWAARAPKRYDSEWPTRHLYGGLLAENATQGASRDLLAQALLAQRDWVLHSHDELVADDADCTPEDVRRIMLAPHDWARGLPLEAKVIRAARYAKE
jgi:DNA polymerase